MASLNFKSAAFAVAVGAATLTGGFATTKVAMADEPPITLQTDCQKYKPGQFGQDAVCQKEKLRLSELAKKEAARTEQLVDQKLLSAKRSENCVDKVTSEIENAKKLGPLSPEAKAVFKSRIYACMSGAAW